MESEHYSLTGNFFDTAHRYSSKPALKEKVDGVYRSMTYQEMKERVEQVAAFLIKAGMRPGERMALLSENRPEWPICDMGLISAGLVNVPIYPTLTAAQLAYILNDSECKVIIVSRPAQLQKVKRIAGECPKLKGVILLDDIPPGKHIEGLKIFDYKTVISEGEVALKERRPELDARMAQARPDDLVSIVYTSGTTAQPKGVMLSHRNFASNASDANEALQIDFTDTLLSFLPLSHVLERVVNYVVQLTGATIAYAESIDTLATNMQEVQPTTFVAVPRVFEKIHSRIMQTIEHEKPLKRRVFYWALDLGKQLAELRIRGQEIPRLLTQKHALAQRLIFSKIQERTGGQVKFAVSGGAPLMPELAEFFFAVGIDIYEGYGLTETSPVICVNRAGAVRFGSVGQPIRNVEVKIADDGEILTRGPHVMRGYLNQPEATAEVIDENGWFHTGDIGEISEEGFLRITDRKKEIIVMSNGKNVAPQPVENRLKSSKYIEQAVMVGNNQKYIGALIYPNLDALEFWAQNEGLEYGHPKALLKDEAVYKFMRKEINRITREFARFEQIKKFTFIEEELTQDNGCLTPTLKFKRRIINERYQDKINELFAEALV